MQISTAASPVSILHLEDSEIDHQLVRRALDQGALAFSMIRVDDQHAFIDLVRTQSFDVILADYRLVGFTALEAWSVVSNIGLQAPFILVSGTIGEAAAVAAIQLGISDYLHKDELSRLPLVIRRSLEIQSAKQAKRAADIELAASERRLAEFAEHLQTTIEHERAAISREIHDDIGGSLVAAKLDLSWLDRHSSDPLAKSHIQAAVEMLMHAMGASQRIMMNLRPSVLDQGLVAAIQWLADSFEKRNGIQTIVITNNEQLSPPKPVVLAAYRTAQEALTNASKYAACEKVRIEISDANGTLTLEVTDNGRGFSADEIEKPQAFGIKGLRERAKTVGGWLDVISRGGEGTSVILTVPLSLAHEVSPEETFR